MATITQRLTALEAFRDDQQRPWNKATSDRIAALEAKVAKLEGATTPTPPVPVPTEKIVKLGPSDPQSALVAAANDMTVDGVDLASGDYKWDTVKLDVDRTLRPFRIRGTAGTRFVSDGGTSEGVFFLGLTKVAKYITFSDLAFDNILLSQAGVFEFRSSDHCTLRRITMTNLRRDPQWSDKAGKTWGVYLSGQGAGGAGNKHFLGEDISVSPKAYRDVGAIQMDSSSAQSTDIVFRRILAERCDYAFYGAVPVTGLILDDWTVSDSSNPNGTAVRFSTANISGRYSNIRLVAGSGKVSNSSPSMVAA